VLFLLDQAWLEIIPGATVNGLKTHSAAHVAFQEIVAQGWNRVAAVMVFTSM
jgi:hypothetical protein